MVVFVIVQESRTNETKKGRGERLQVGGCRCNGRADANLPMVSFIHLSRIPTWQSSCLTTLLHAQNDGVLTWLISAMKLGHKAK
jgi:hypothetical protein